MQYTVPHYYHKFSCIAGECADTCCAGWGIKIDGQSLKQYRKQKDGFGNRLLNSIDWKEGSFKQYKGRCVFLNENNLCDIHLEAGPELLCRTCKEYPRHTEVFKGLREISLSLSCAEAARLILDCKEPVRFITKEKEGEETDPDFDFFLFGQLMKARDFLLSILQNRALNLPLRLSIALGFAHDLQRRISLERLYETEELIKRYQSAKCPEMIEKRLETFKMGGEERFERRKELFRVFDRMEVLKSDWPQYIGSLKALLFENGREEYEKLEQEFKEYLNASEERKTQWNQWGEQLAVYFIFTYFCGAVYDGRAYDKVRLALISLLLIQDMAMAKWKDNGGVLELEDMVDLAHRYSKEAEHSDYNLEMLDRKVTRKLRLLCVLHHWLNVVK